MNAAPQRVARSVWSATGLPALLGTWSRTRVLKRRQAARTYSPSKVIHGWRGELATAPPQPTVNNFGGGKKMSGQQLTILRTPTSRRLYGEFRSETLRPVAKEYSEPFACKYKLGRDEPL